MIKRRRPLRLLRRVLQLRHQILQLLQRARELHLPRGPVIVPRVQSHKVHRNTDALHLVVLQVVVEPPVDVDHAGAPHARRSGEHIAADLGAVLVVDPRGVGLDQVGDALLVEGAQHGVGVAVVLGGGQEQGGKAGVGLLERDAVDAGKGLRIEDLGGGFFAENDLYRYVDELFVDGGALKVLGLENGKTLLDFFADHLFFKVWWWW